MLHFFNTDINFLVYYVFCTEGVLKKTLRFPPTPVPPVKDTHMCLGIQLPDDIVVNQKLPVAVVPHLDNKVVMHHVNLWGCASVPSKCHMCICQY